MFGMDHAFQFCSGRKELNCESFTLRFVPAVRVMQMSFDMNDGYVNTLTVADFNLFLCAIQGDTRRFEHLERFIKVRTLL